MSLTQNVKSYALELGLQAVGITSVEPFPQAEEVMVDRIKQGLYAGLPWFTEGRAQLACQPELLLPEARSIISLAASYAGPEPEPPTVGGPWGRISRFALGEDYHHVLKKRLEALLRYVADRSGAAQGRIFVDASPLPERAVARRAGLGWYGKSANIFVPELGSWVFLAEVLTEAELEADAPLRKNCGRCDICLRACPTGALVAPYAVDSRRCTSYLTIECRGSVPVELRAAMGDWVFGCDVCQEVCPVNRRARQPEESLIPAKESPYQPLRGLLGISEAEFAARFRRSPIKRAKRLGLRRNAAIALGNSGDRDAVPPLACALEDPEPLLRAHAAWALGRLGGRRAQAVLERALAREGEVAVREEARWALEGA